MHQCAKCLSPGHAAKDCNYGEAPSQRRPGKGKGKGGKGKGRPQN